jgi:hypothetical protein
MLGWHVPPQLNGKILALKEKLKKGGVNEKDIEAANII